jgi:hypothetical protein
MVHRPYENMISLVPFEIIWLTNNKFLVSLET